MAHYSPLSTSETAEIDLQAVSPGSYGDAYPQDPAYAMPQQQPSSKLFAEEKLPSLDGLEPGEDGKFHCTWENCIKTGQIRSELTKHLRTHYKPVLCPLCDVRKPEQRDMKRHVATAHRAWAQEHYIDTAPVTCDICGQECTRNDNLKKHMKKMHPKNK